MVEKTDAFEALKVLANMVPQKQKTEDEWFPAYITMLKYLRSSEPVRRGKWVFDGWGILCSECGYRPKLSGGWDYCPVCGAMMGEE